MTTLTDVETIKLPEAILDGPVSLEAALQKRRSVREYGDRRLTLARLSQLLWAGRP